MTSQGKRRSSFFRRKIFAYLQKSSKVRQVRLSLNSLCFQKNINLRLKLYYIIFLHNAMKIL